MKFDYIVVLVTTPDEKVAEKIGNILIEKKFAACVNIVKDINSIYFWKGKIENDSEALMIIKTRYELFEELSNQIKSQHPYTVPEIIGIPILTGSDTYLNWIDETVYR